MVTARGYSCSRPRLLLRRGCKPDQFGSAVPVDYNDRLKGIIRPDNPFDLILLIRKETMIKAKGKQAPISLLVAAGFSIRIAEKVITSL